MVLELMLASAFLVVRLHALRRMAALLRAVALPEHSTFNLRRTRLRAGIVFALPSFQGSLGWDVR